VLDDTPTTPEQITGAFGPAVSAMVVKVSKLSQVNQMLRRDKRKVRIVQQCSHSRI
jgi:(p)ppGpp synthase/HD superfamily hydrolase